MTVHFRARFTEPQTSTVLRNNLSALLCFESRRLLYLHDKIQQRSLNVLHPVRNAWRYHDRVAWGETACLTTLDGLAPRFIGIGGLRADHLSSGHDVGAALHDVEDIGVAV